MNLAQRIGQELKSVNTSMANLSGQIQTQIDSAILALDTKSAETLVEIQLIIDTALTSINTKLTQAEEDIAAAVEAAEMLIPSQTGQKGKVLTTNGVNTEWKDAGLSYASLAKFN